MSPQHPETTSWDRRPSSTQPAGLARRIGALVIDWLLASAISAGFFAFDSWATLAIFAAMTLILVATLGSTIGHRVLGLRVVRADDGGHPGIVSAIVRTVALCLVIPAVIWDSEGVSLHDRWARTRIVERAR
ncbi:RDD domain containing protein [Beutenbergia cavernae DSM 12333]|uniref:RDD domain containing protein n=1 Tax=Beutenbergia cavernae (strain ATCC BAA-8 / DSM 12333 / CCUG 43141 / JCM 11478 / NBRC 16432 / NCIMB 13614 / HKI 0122) TaxID=471853 RepID=C5C4Y4_BEUC1|nr:RDD family protein [Beutenbergia cavernae]ACQ80112.1 RDD domain containing protein [Beutenbergia cavernae DSM 12333]